MSMGINHREDVMLWGLEWFAAFAVLTLVAAAYPPVAVPMIAVVVIWIVWWRSPRR